MKIFSCNVKPAMIIRRTSKKFKEDYLLVTSISTGDTIEITGFPSQDSYYGRVVQFFNPTDKIKVLTNTKKQKKVVKSILNDAFSHLHQAEEDVSLIKLMQRFI